MFVVAVGFARSNREPDAKFSRLVQAEFASTSDVNGTRAFYFVYFKQNEYHVCSIRIKADLVCPTISGLPIYCVPAPNGCFVTNLLFDHACPLTATHE